VISAVGHEIDTTLSDLVADRRAATPSAAAEICTLTSEELNAFLDATVRRIHSRFASRLTRSQRDMHALAKQLERCPVGVLDSSRQQLRHLTIRHSKASAGRVNETRIDFARLSRSLEHEPRTLIVGRVRQEQIAPRLASVVRGRLNESRIAYAGWRRYQFQVVVSRLESLRAALVGQERRLLREAERRVSESTARHKAAGGLFDAVSPTSVLRRGYAIVQSSDGKIIRAARELHPKMPVKLVLSEGSAGAEIIDIDEGAT
jgi:exodeoxyribonuclease VII large subunit